MLQSLAQELGQPQGVPLPTGTGLVLADGYFSVFFPHPATARVLVARPTFSTRGPLVYRRSTCSPSSNTEFAISLAGFMLRWSFTYCYNSAPANAVINVRVCSSKRSDRSGRRDFEATQETETRRSFTTVSRSIDRYIRFERLILSSWTTISFTKSNLLSSGGNHHLHYGIVCLNLLQGPGSVS